MQRPISSTISRPAGQDDSHANVQWEANNTSKDQFRLIDLIDNMCAGKDVFFRLVRTVADIMPNNVKTLTLDDTVAKALEFMKQSRIRHVCIVDIPMGEENKPYFVGVVSERDIFRQISPGKEKAGGGKTNLKVPRQFLGQVVTRKPKTVSPETSIPSMLSIMLENHVDMVPVIDEEGLVSIVTTTDVMKLIIRLDTIRRVSVKPKQIPRKIDKIRSANLPSAGADDVAKLLTTVLQTVKDMMTEQVVYLGTGDNMAAAMEAMKNGEFRHVPVVDDEGKMVGIVSDRDVLRYLPFVSGQRLPGEGTFRSSLFHVNAKDPSLSLPVSSIMTRNVTHVLPNFSFYDAVKMLHELKISCLPVVDEKRKLRGMVTVSDAMRALLRVYELIEKSNSKKSIS